MTEEYLKELSRVDKKRQKNSVKYLSSSYKYECDLTDYEKETIEYMYSRMIFSIKKFILFIGIPVFILISIMFFTPGYANVDISEESIEFANDSLLSDIDFRSFEVDNNVHMSYGRKTLLIDEYIGVWGYSLFIDGNRIVSTSNEEGISEAIDYIIDKYSVFGDSYKFDNEYTIEKDYVRSDDIKLESDVLKLLITPLNDPKTYIIEDGDAPWIVASEVGMNMNEIDGLNPGFVMGFKTGDEIYLDYPIFILNLISTTPTEFDEIVSFKVVEVNNENKYRGMNSVINDGKDGTKKVYANILKINGLDAGLEIVNEEIIEEPEDRVISVGTIPLPAKYGTGEFIYPVEGEVYKDYESASGYGHNGIDIIVPNDTLVYAPDSGLVTFAGYMNGYEYLVIIDHDNGFESYVGNLRNLAVETGQRVSKGERIGEAGISAVNLDDSNTYIHFEIRKDFYPVDPKKYIKR